MAFLIWLYCIILLDGFEDILTGWFLGMLGWLLLQYYYKRAITNYDKMWDDTK